MGLFFHRSLVGKKAQPVSGEAWFNDTALPAAVREVIARGEPIDIRRDLSGWVVVINFWDYSCINCLTMLPYLRTWWQRYREQPFLLLGVHTPEFEFGREADRVSSAVLRFALPYPVVSDPEYATWRRYGNDVWPRTLLMDGQGVVRYDHRGEGDYEVAERTIQQLLAQVKPGIDFAQVVAPFRREDAAGAACYPISPAMYIGFGKGEPVNEGGIRERVVSRYSLPVQIPLHRWALAGEWEITPEEGISRSTNEAARVILTYEATEVFVVMRSTTSAMASVEVIQDDVHLLPVQAGEDVSFQNGKSMVAVTADKMYRLVRNPKHGRHTLELLVSSNVAVHVFTFGTSCID